MSDDTVANRVSRYLTRHISHLESALSVLESFDAESQESVETFAREQTARDTASTQLLSERAALLKEWHNGEGVNAGERARVRELAQRAELLAGELQQAYAAAGALASRAAAVVQWQADAARRGAGVARKFGNDAQDAGGFVDWTG